MGLLRRRFPLFVRPLPFFLFALVAAVGLYWGLNWDWHWSLQTGHVFILVVVPTSLLTFEGGKLVLLMIGLAAAACAFRFGTLTRRGLRRQLRSAPRRRSAWPAFRFYPFTFAFGAFVLYFGLVFLFDASVYGDSAQGASVAFIYLDYAGMADRLLVTLIGTALVVAGLACCTLLAVSPGLGGRSPGPAPGPSGPLPPQPSSPSAA